MYFLLFIEIIQASYSGAFLQKSDFDNLLLQDQQLLLLVTQNEDLVAIWNNLYQKFESKYYMGIIDCVQTQDLCNHLEIKEVPQMILVDQSIKTLIYYVGDWNENELSQWILGENNSENELDDHSEEHQEYEIILEVIQPEQKQENVEWVTDIQEHENHDHHSENLEKTLFEELSQLENLNEILSSKQRKLQSSLNQINQSLQILSESVDEIEAASKIPQDLSIYLFSCLSFGIISFIFSFKYIHTSKLKTHILVQ